VQAAAGRTGTLSATLGAATLAATGTVALKGTLTKTLGALTSAATGTVALQGTLSKTLGALSLAATGELTSSGSGTLTQILGAATLAATGTVALAGNVSATLGALTLAATATNDSPVVAVPAQKGAGRSRRRKKYTVEIDGQQVEVSSEREAVELLEAVAEKAKKTAEVAVSRAVKAKAKPRRDVIKDAKKTLQAPVIAVSDELDPIADMIRRSVEKTYADAMQSIEISLLLRKLERDEEDDEDVLLLLV
jgi:hypothetical protein